MSGKMSFTLVRRVKFFELLDLADHSHHQTVMSPVSQFLSVDDVTHRHFLIDLIGSSKKNKKHKGHIHDSLTRDRRGEQNKQ
jgi:hypothetical protein